MTDSADYVDMIDAIDERTCRMEWQLAQLRDMLDQVIAMLAEAGAVTVRCTVVPDDDYGADCDTAGVIVPRC